MSARTFKKERTVYWPAELEHVVDALTGKNARGVATGSPMYKFNTGAIVFAATVGLKYQCKREVGSDKKEINTSTFESHDLATHLFLIVMLGLDKPDLEVLDVDILREEQEELIVREFEQYAAGGLEYLNAEFDKHPNQSPEVVIERMCRDTPGTSDAVLPELPDI